MRQEHRSTILLLLLWVVLILVSFSGELWYDVVDWGRKRTRAFGRHLSAQSNYDDDDAHYALDDDNKSNNYDAYIYSNSGIIRKCDEFLKSFLKSATNGREKCEGINYAYAAADCTFPFYGYYEDFDDYFNDFQERECCTYISHAYHRTCFGHQQLSSDLLAGAVILLLCQTAKVIALKIPFVLTFVTEPAICILVGMLGGSFLYFTDFTDFSYNDSPFVTFLLPPIIFESALSINKRELKKHQGTILLLSYFGPILTTFTVGFMIHYGSALLWNQDEKFPLLDALVFGSVISSIYPLSNVADPTIHTLLHGESVLSDAASFTLFQILVARFDQSGSIYNNHSTTTSLDEVLGCAAIFLRVMASSILIGVLGGCCAFLYFRRIGKDFSTTRQVASFFLWAMIPGYISAGIGMSGLISVGTAGFFMDVFIAGPRDFLDANTNNFDTSTQPKRDGATNSLPACPSMPEMMDPLYQNNHQDGVFLSSFANKQVRFVAYVVAQLCEDTIFAYLGVFLVNSNRDDWDVSLVLLSIFSCMFSRTVMVFLVAVAIVKTYKWCGLTATSNNDFTGSQQPKSLETLSDTRSLMVLVLAGLRGTVSLALIEKVPMYNASTGEGSEFKQVMKGMTVASILFTIFVIGGSAACLFPVLGHPLSRPFEKQESRT